jgi:lipoprotein-anchoring transpeptidase ErfK/SrfK
MRRVSHLLVLMSAATFFVHPAKARVTDFSSAFRAESDVRFVNYNGSGSPGSIEVRTGERALYFILPTHRAIRYRVGVGRAGQQWFGSTAVVSKHVRPAWLPPAVIRGGKPPTIIPPESPKNPLGVAALVLADHELAIHGTNNPQSIGGYVSWGCIRMYNEDIADLFDRVTVGTPVVITH